MSIDRRWSLRMGCQSIAYYPDPLPHEWDASSSHGFPYRWDASPLQATPPPPPFPSVLCWYVEYKAREQQVPFFLSLWFSRGLHRRPPPLKANALTSRPMTNGPGHHGEKRQHLSVKHGTQYLWESDPPTKGCPANRHSTPIKMRGRNQGPFQGKVMCFL